MLGKGLTHGARQVDAVVIPFERAARAARDAMPREEPGLASAPAASAEPQPRPSPSARTPLPAQPAGTPCAIEDLMRLAADAGLVRHVEAICALSRRTVRLVPGDGPPAGRSRLGGAPDMPASEVWPNWDAEPLTFLCQIDLAEAAAAGIDEALPPDGLLLVFCAAEQTPSGTSPLDRGSACVLYVEPGRVPAVAPEPIGPSLPREARALELSCELAIPRVWTAAVQALGLDDAEQDAWERARCELAELQGLEPWDAGSELRSEHHLLGYPHEMRGDMQLLCELVARGVDVGYGAPAMHPEGSGLDGIAERWRLLLQLTIDDALQWRFGHGRERLYLWGPEDELADGITAQVHGIAR